MNDVFSASANRCQYTRGVILVTPCPGAAVDRCFRCHIRLCAQHAVPFHGEILCPTCEATGETYVADDFGDSSTVTDPGIDDPATANDEGVEELSTPTVTDDPTRDDDLFTAEDYDAFDSAGDADMNAGIRDGFDS
jgi:hypothetical protein